MIKLPFGAGPSPSSLRLVVPTGVSCTFIVFCSLTKEYQFNESRWKVYTQDWIEHQTTSPLGPALDHAVNSNIVKVDVKRMVDIERQLGPDMSDADLAEDVAERISHSGHGIVVQARDDLRYPRAGLWLAYATARALSEKLCGLMWDLDAARLMSPSTSFKQLHVHGTPLVKYFVSVKPMPSKPGIQRVSTCGMPRFGLPELELQNEFPVALNLLSDVLLTIAQKLATETMALLTVAGGPGYRLRLPAELLITADEPWIDSSGRDPFSPPPSGELPLRLRSQNRPDKSNVLVIRPPRDHPGEARAWLDTALSLVTGISRSASSASDTPLPAVDGEELEALRREFMDDLNDPPRAAVRYRTSTPYGVAYRWLIVSSWISKKVRGHSVSSPDDVPDFVSGVIVEADERDIVEIRRPTLNGNKGAR